jgi:hypothetical protein
MLLVSWTVREQDGAEFAALIRELRDFRERVQQGLDAAQIVRSLPTADAGPKTAAAPRRSRTSEFTGSFPQRMAS